MSTGCFKIEKWAPAPVVMLNEQTPPSGHHAHPQGPKCMCHECHEAQVAVRGQKRNTSSSHYKSFATSLISPILSTTNSGDVGRNRFFHSHTKHDPPPSFLKSGASGMPKITASFLCRRIVLLSVSIF